MAEIILHYGPPTLFFSSVFVIMYFMFGGKRA